MLTAANNQNDRLAVRWWQVLVALVLVTAAGCASSGIKWVTVRGTPRNPLASTLHLLSKEGPQPSPRTAQVLRRFALEDSARRDLSETIARLSQYHQSDPNRELQYSIAELAYIAGKRAEKRDRSKALSHFGTSLLYAYDYLFDQQQLDSLNPYDPQFRGACDLYNQSLEETLRLVQADGNLRPGTQGTVHTVGHQCTFDIELHSSGWHANDFDNFRFVSDYQLSGLRNHYHTYGLGVPIIAERRSHEQETDVEQFYPDKLTFPLTAFLRVHRHDTYGPVSKSRERCTPAWSLSCTTRSIDKR